MRADLDAEFQFHDQFKTIANGTNYGAVTVASCQETAIGASGLGLPSDHQPIEDDADPTRETMLSHVRPLSKSQQTVSALRHDAGNDSLMAKWSLPSGGALLGQDMVWGTRVPMPKPLPGFWLAGDRWSKGAEMDVVESFGTVEKDAVARCVASVAAPANLTGQLVRQYVATPASARQDKHASTVAAPPADRLLAAAFGCGVELAGVGGAV